MNETYKIPKTPKLETVPTSIDENFAQVAASTAAMDNRLTELNAHLKVLEKELRTLYVVLGVKD